MTTTDTFRIALAGDATMVVEFEERIDLVVNARAIRLAEAVQAAGISGIRDVVPTYRSVAVCFDPLRTDSAALAAWLEDHAGLAEASSVDSGRAPIDVPVCYGGDLGPDLAGVASRAKMPPDEVVACHAAAIYRVFMLGFVPGFAYLGVLDERIRTPRHATPRVRVPRGSVAIADAQTGVYPSETPGGWQLIGRTPIRTFDPTREEPCLFKPGDAVRFVPIDRTEYEATTR